MDASTRILGLFLLGSTAMAQLPPAPVPAENPTTPAKVLLGKMLFWDEQLSSDDSVACGTCHLPEAGGGDPRTPTATHPGADGLFGSEDDVLGSPGIAAQNATSDFRRSPTFGTRTQVTGRQAPSNLGAARHNELFWDGRASTTFVDPETNTIAIPFFGALESQALGPILSPVEMGQDGRTWNDVRNKLASVRPLRLASELPADVASALTTMPSYPALFAAAFGDSAITARRIAFALASYQRTLEPNQTPFDLSLAGDASALTPAQKVGRDLFFGAANCAFCHPAPFFSDDQFHNLGLRPSAEDLGREGFSGVAAERGAFKTPSLRNAGLRPRLFHNGQSPRLGVPDQISDIRSVANVYLRGGGADRTDLDPAIVPLITMGVNLQDLEHVLDFVQNGLTDPRAANGLPPFDHPRLRTQAVLPPQEYGNSLAGASEPGFITTAPTFLGNKDWKLGLHGGDGDTIGVVFYAPAPSAPGAQIAGVPVNIGIDADYAAFMLHGSAGSPGLTTWHLEIPGDPALDGLVGYFQLFTADPMAPIGIAASRGLRLQVN